MAQPRAWRCAASRRRYARRACWSLSVSLFWGLSPPSSAIFSEMVEMQSKRRMRARSAPKVRRCSRADLSRLRSKAPNPGTPNPGTVYRTGSASGHLRLARVRQIVVRKAPPRRAHRIAPVRWGSQARPNQPGHAARSNRCGLLFGAGARQELPQWPHGRIADREYLQFVLSLSPLWTAIQEDAYGSEWYWRLGTNLLRAPIIASRARPAGSMSGSSPTYRGMVSGAYRARKDRADPCRCDCRGARSRLLPGQRLASGHNRGAERCPGPLAG